MTRRTGSRHVAVVPVTTAFLLAAALSGVTVGVVDADTPSVSVTDGAGGNTTEAPPGETLTLTVGANASNVSAYQANLTFDPDVVQVVSVSGTADFDDPVNNVDNETGWVAFNQYRSSAVDDPQLATVTIELVGGGGNETALSFAASETKLANETARERGIEEYDGLTVSVESDSAGSDDEDDDGNDGNDDDNASDGDDANDGNDGDDNNGGNDGNDANDDDGAGGGGGGAIGGTDDATDVDVTTVADGVTVSVSDPSSGEDVEADVDGEVAGQGVAVQSMAIEHRVTPDDYRIEFTNVGADPTGSTSRLDRAVAIGYLDIEPIGTDRIAQAAIDFTIEDDALPANTSPEAVRLYHYTDGWVEFQTDYVGSDGEAHEFTATTDGFSPFAIGVVTPDIAVTDAALARDQTAVGETVSVTATVENEGSAEGSTTVALTIDDAVRNETEVTVPPGERTEVTFTTTLDETGEYTVTVDETAAGDLSVVEPGTSSDTDTPPDGDTSSGTDASTDTDDETTLEEQATGFGAIAGVITLLILGLLARRR